MKTVACIILGLTFAAASYSRFFEEPFITTYWYANVVVVGKVTKVSDETFDFEVQEWLRPHGDQSREIIHAHRYAVPSDVGPPVYVPLSAGSRYLLLLGKPSGYGAADKLQRLVLQQVALAESSICMKGTNGLFKSGDERGCLQSITRLEFLDAMRSFDGCFELEEDRIKGTYPIAKKCSDDAIDIWAGRSVFHAELAKAALRSIERRGP